MTKKNDVEEFSNFSQFRHHLWLNLRKQTRHVSNGKKSLNTKLDNLNEVKDVFESLKNVEKFFAFPGQALMNRLADRLKKSEFSVLHREVSDTIRALISETYRKDSNVEITSKKMELDCKSQSNAPGRNYFETLFIDDIREKDRESIHKSLASFRTDQDPFFYNLVFSGSYQEALAAVIFNPLIQAIVIRYQIPSRKLKYADELKPYLANLPDAFYDTTGHDDLQVLFAERVRRLRPELDIYYVTDTVVSETSGRMLKIFKRLFYRMEDLQELHMCIIKGVKERFQTPFFSALVEYSQKPTGVFHAMPISRGNSVFRSSWIKDFGDFYGRNLFLAETSSTSGGLDSLLQPVGPIKKAQELAARAYRSEHSYFVTNGTSTSNKIVLQALVKPGDIVLIDRECHKSHHYALVLSGAIPIYLDSYKVSPYTIYGGVSIEILKQRLLECKEHGTLDKVKMVILTNCTFDGIVYNPQLVMEELLKIKGDLIFLWDEAWFGFASFSPFLRSRTAMAAARRIYNRYRLGKRSLDGNPLDNNQSSEDKESNQFRLRVYSTQSTHKTLSSFRQGSMIHIFDEDFDAEVQESFQESYMTHISTSPNYQILASLDVGRRQAELEGFELTNRAIEMAMTLRQKIQTHPKLKRYFRVLSAADLIPQEFRSKGSDDYINKDNHFLRYGEHWKNDEFALDPTKLTLCISKIGVDGTVFRNRFLMDKFGIQINKTSRNTVLFMTNIGTTRSSVAYLIRALLQIADDVQTSTTRMLKEELKIHEKNVHSFLNDPPPMPSFSYFHDSFRPAPSASGGDMREAFYMAYNQENCEFHKLSECLEVVKSGGKPVSANFVTPYPPGFPVLVPGQVVTEEILEFLLRLDVKEIHGYNPNLGLRLFTTKVLERHKVATSWGMRKTTPTPKKN